jgi:general transcription factor 3C polypeptide 3 (transcription factor C subunit 4)
MALADCYNGINDPSSAIRTIRNGARWLQGRAQKEKWWENVGDDREFDVPGFARGGGASVAGGDGAGEMAQGFYDLDLNLRHRLAVARLKLGDEDEGKVGTRRLIYITTYDWHCFRCTPV